MERHPPSGVTLKQTKEKNMFKKILEITKKYTKKNNCNYEILNEIKKQNELLIFICKEIKRNSDLVEKYNKHYHIK